MIIIIRSFIIVYSMKFLLIKPIRISRQFIDENSSGLKHIEGFSYGLGGRHQLGVTVITFTLVCEFILPPFFTEEVGFEVSRRIYDNY